MYVIDMGGPGLIDCEYCGNEKVRYVSVMQHHTYGGILKVGCICAGRLSGDEASARQRIKDYKSTQKRYDNFRAKCKIVKPERLKGNLLVVKYLGVELNVACNVMWWANNNTFVRREVKGSYDLCKGATWMPAAFELIEKIRIYRR